MAGEREKTRGRVSQRKSSRQGGVSRERREGVLLRCGAGGGVTRQSLEVSPSRRRRWTFWTRRKHLSFTLYPPPPAPPPPFGKMTTHYLQQDFLSKAVNGEKKLPRVNASLQESIAHLHPLQRQHAIELHRQQQQQSFNHPQVQASLSTFTACTVPASCRARSRFLNLRDSVKKSPTKSTAKVLKSARKEISWVPFAYSKVATSCDLFRDFYFFHCGN